MDMRCPDCGLTYSRSETICCPNGCGEVSQFATPMTDKPDAREIAHKHVMCSADEPGKLPYLKSGKHTEACNRLTEALTAYGKAHARAAIKATASLAKTIANDRSGEIKRRILALLDTPKSPAPPEGG